jgi:hypothetical protein
VQDGKARLPINYQVEAYLETIGAMVLATPMMGHIAVLALHGYRMKMIVGAVKERSFTMKFPEETLVGI